MQTSFVYVEKEERRIPKGSPVMQECLCLFSRGETEREGPKTTTSNLTSSFQKPAASFSGHTKSLQGEQELAYLACMPLFAELAHKTWIGPEVYE